MCKDNQQDKEDQEFLDLAWEVSQLRKELELIQSLHSVAVRERDYERTLCDQYKKELFEEREEYERETQRLRSLCLRAADEIEMLDDIIIRNNLEEQMDEEYPGVASVNLLSRLRGRIKGGYVENYPELTEE